MATSLALSARSKMRKSSKVPDMGAWVSPKGEPSVRTVPERVAKVRVEFAL